MIFLFKLSSSISIWYPRERILSGLDGITFDCRAMLRGEGGEESKLFDGYLVNIQGDRNNPM